MIDKKDLHLQIFRPPVAPVDSAKFEAVYSFWRRMWADAYKEMGKPSLASSDHFTRQHDILAIFYRDQPIASVCHRYADLSCASTYADSYFQYSWTEKETSALKSGGGIGVLGSQITVDPLFRRPMGDLSMKYLTSFLSLYYAHQLNVDVILGMMRVDRGMDRVFYEAGARQLAPRMPYFDVLVDLVAFYPKQEALRLPVEYQDMVESLVKSARVSAPLVWDQQEQQDQQGQPTRRVA